MPQYWVKPFGITEPPVLMKDDWTTEWSLDRFELMTGPPNPKKPPQMGRGDAVLIHAVGHVRIFAAGEILENPFWRKDPEWGLRWPWIYPCRVDVWVPLIEDGPHSTGVLPKKAIGKIMAGGEFSRLSRDEYMHVLEELLASPAARNRDPAA